MVTRLGSSSSFSGLSSHGSLPALDQENEYTKSFIKSISEMSPGEQMAQIGIEPSALGIPSSGATFDRCRSLFADDAFDQWEPGNVPKSWAECSNVQSAVSKAVSFPDLTLFFMFYTQPRDICQIAAAQELTNRGWKYIANTGRWEFAKEAHLFVFDVQMWMIRDEAENKAV